MDRIKVLPEQCTASRHCLFSADSKRLFLFKRNATVDIFRILVQDDIVDMEFELSIDLSRSLKGPIGHIRLSHCGEYLVCSDVCCNIAVWRYSNESWSHHINLPKYSMSPVAIAIHKNAPKLVAAFSDGKIFEYHLEEMRFLCAATTFFVDNQERYAIKNITLDPRNENVFIAHNDTYMFVLKKEYVSILSIVQFCDPIDISDLIFIHWTLFTFRVNQTNTMVRNELKRWRRTTMTKPLPH